MGNMMTDFSLQLKHKNAICYSGYRHRQDPRSGVFPSYEQIKEDLLILVQHWSVLRLYDCSHHAHMVLSVIRNESLPLQIMLGVDLAAEVSNPNCPWGAHYPEHELQHNQHVNQQHIMRMIDFANAYPEIVFSVSIGNEASVEWNDHMVPVDRLIHYARQVKGGCTQPVTFCENYVPWTNKLLPLVEHLDFISIHTYPAWEYKSVDEAIAYTQENYQLVKTVHPKVPIVVTEAGWTTRSNGRGIEVHNANEQIQMKYYQDLMHWAELNDVLTFVFEAFDEPWKGSDDENEPEKHWGLFYENRQPKPVMQALFDQPQRYNKAV